MQRHYILQGHHVHLGATSNTSERIEVILAPIIYRCPEPLQAWGYEVACLHSHRWCSTNTMHGNIAIGKNLVLDI